MGFFSYRENEYYVEDTPLALIAREVGTPVFVYRSAAFLSSLRAFGQAFAPRPHLVCYSVKVASNLALLSLVAKEGLGADIVSGGELFRALRAGIPASRVVYSGVGKTAAEMREALAAGIMMFNAESGPELALLSSVARDMGLVAPVALRVNPDVDPGTHPYVATGLKESKFGVAVGEALDLYLRASQDPSLRVVGLDCHIGSQLTSVSPFVEAAGRLKSFLGKLRESGISLRYLDLGGGLGITYNQERPPSPAEYAGKVVEALGDEGLTLVLEPGRVVAGNSAVLAIEALYDKITPAKRFIVTNGAMNDLIRPSLYGSYHDIVPARLGQAGAQEALVNVVGPVCESGDFLAKDRLMAIPAQGDLLAVRSAGAYGFSMSSNYNSRPRAAEVLVEGDSFRVIRARETYEDLVRGETP
ncbi:MAG: diaminopimelate decarboxylase [Deltaproteobacteria bacterium]|jgi:diaminopimelate decarboxylase|nr:diaminopimelate decarboxylase [Deltaproteobacteria bacterium]